MAKKQRERVVFSEDKEQALETALKQIEKQYGKGSIMKMGEKSNIDIDVIPTGSMSVDMVTGIGGVPRGRVIEIYGPESSGKTTLALQIIAEAQKLGGKAAFIDAEHALDPVYSAKLGVQIDDMLVSQPDTGEQGLEICELLTRSGAIDVIVVDSVAALVPVAEIQGEIGDSHVGTQARMMSQALRRLTSAISKSNTCVIFINQLREKIGNMYGPSETTTGGRALKFYASMRLEVRKGEAIKKGDNTLGARTKVKVAKNKLAPPFGRAEFDLIYGTGISKSGDILDCATEAEIIEKAGSWYSYKGNHIGQGRENSKKYLEENPDIMQELYDKLLDTLKTDETEGEPEISVDEDGVILG